ncbi:MAG TPA: hypothetical protein VKS44_09075 [Candidatus Acidoferrales bacterium]|nr:hypothetical protein [Candidatus Acidoferrales bacterium]
MRCAAYISGGLSLIVRSLAVLCAFPTLAAAQNSGAPSIRVQSGQVILPVMAFDKNSQHYVPGLTARDFRVFEDGSSQTIQQASVEHVYLRDFRDNSGVEEREWAWTPGQMWSLLDEGPFSFAASSPAFYLLSYALPPSAAGSCHRVSVKVGRKNVIVRARSEYCNTPHSPADPLDGTEFSKQMERDAASEKKGKIPLFVQAGFFYTDAKTPRAYIAVEYPTDDIPYSAGPKLLAAKLGFLTEVFRQDGTLAARSSDLDEEYFLNPEDENRILGHPDATAPRIPTDVRSISPDYSLADAMRRTFMANRHETQMDLPAGTYDLRVVLSDGEKFGRAEVPLTVEAYDGEQLGISSIALCKQFNDPRQNLEHAAARRNSARAGAPVSTLSHFVPLISRGNAFTPAGHTSFKSNETLFAYYEVYEPLLLSAPATRVRVRVRILDDKTGAIRSDTGQRNAAEWVRPGNLVISVAQQAPITVLPRGRYRIEVQASDSAGRATALRTAIFTVK